MQRCWNIKKDEAEKVFIPHGPNEAMYAEIMKAIRKLQQQQERKCKHLRGKAVPGKNLSKNSQCDGNNDQEPSTSKKGQRKNSRVAAKNAKKIIADQAQVVDHQMPQGDKVYEPNFEEEENESDDCSEELSDASESMDDDYQSAQSVQQHLRDDPDPPPPVPPLTGAVEHCWVEAFELEVNSKRLDAFSIPSNDLNLTILTAILTSGNITENLRSHVLILRPNGRKA